MKTKNKFEKQIPYITVGMTLPGLMMLTTLIGMFIFTLMDDNIIVFGIMMGLLFIESLVLFYCIYNI